jgi:hypothetical protein
MVGLGKRAKAMIAAGVYSFKDGFGTANTAFAFFDDMLWVVNEADAPYWVSTDGSTLNPKPQQQQHNPSSQLGHILLSRLHWLAFFLQALHSNSVCHYDVVATPTSMCIGTKC